MIVASQLHTTVCGGKCKYYEFGSNDRSFLGSQQYKPIHLTARGKPLSHITYTIGASNEVKLHEYKEGTLADFFKIIS